MTATTTSLPVGAAAVVAAQVSDTLAFPPPLASHDNDRLSSSRWRPQSLSKGAAGVAILHAVRAQTGHGGDERVHAWLARAAAEDLTIGPGTGLWFGATAVAFAIATSAPRSYRHAMNRLDAVVVRLTQARLDAADARMAAAARPSLSEFDLVRGLTGLGAHLLHRDQDGELVRRVLDYLVRLTEPVPADDAAGADAPGWWTNDTPSSQPDLRGGHAGLGMAHGIAGPLALLASAKRRGVTVAGHAEAIDRICHFMDAWRQQAPTGPWWPQRVTLADLKTGRPAHLGPGRPSWCYGTPGLARAQQLAALAQGDHGRQVAAEHALAECLADPGQLALLVDPSLCHGWAGLVAIAWYAAADAAPGGLSAHMPDLTHTLIDHADAEATNTPDGLIDGRAGVALVLHAVATSASSRWPTCLLIN
jgi:hypothetical protein